jgi:hypothetical protein
MGLLSNLVGAYDAYVVTETDTEGKTVYDIAVGGVPIAKASGEDAANNFVKSINNGTYTNYQSDWLEFVNDLETQQ